MRNRYTYQIKKSGATFVLVILLSISQFSCKKYITVDTPSQFISTVSAFENDQTAASVLTGIYAQLSDRNTFNQNAGFNSASLLPELSADNLTLNDPNGAPGYRDYYKNSLNPLYSTTSASSTYWVRGYRLLYLVNMAIEQLADNTKLSPAAKKRLLGEAYFMRAFFYFYLVNFYGDLPLILSTDYKQTAMIGKATVSAVYQQIVTDLNMSETQLDYTYVDGSVKKASIERLRPNLAAVNTLQARVYLYLKRYVDSEAAATKVINQTTNYDLTLSAQTFLKNSKEIIWALQPVQKGYNTPEGSLFVLPANGPNATYPVYLSASMVASFEAGDERRNSWTGTVTIGAKSYVYPIKYKVKFDALSTTVTEYPIVIRLAELFLIRAEARNEQGNTTGAVEDLNTLRAKRRAASTLEVPFPLPDLANTLGQEELRPIILKERRNELFTEWAHRWFDLKRSGTLDVVMTNEAIAKGSIWETYKALYPIPQLEIEANKAIKQNPGYIN